MRAAGPDISQHDPVRTALAARFVSISRNRSSACDVQPCMSRHAWAGATLAGLLLLAACGYSAPVSTRASLPTDPLPAESHTTFSHTPGSPPTEPATTVRETSVDAAPPTTLISDRYAIATFDCPLNASCIYAFTLGDEFVQPLCDAVRPELVTDQLLADDTPGLPWSQLSAVQGVDPQVAAAVHDTNCEAKWSLARRGDLGLAPRDFAIAWARARCDVLAQPSDDDRCRSGGAATWTELQDRSTGINAEIGWATFPEYIEQIDAVVADDPAHPDAWRADPSQVAARRLAEPDAVGSVCAYTNLYPGCRVLLRPAPVDTITADVVAFDGILQWIVPMNMPTEQFAQTFPLRVTVERSGGTWWATSYLEWPQIEHGAGDPGRSAADTAAMGFTTVVVEHDWPIATSG